LKSAARVVATRTAEKRPDAVASAATPERQLWMADSTGGGNTLKTAQAVGVLQMKQRRRICYTETQKGDVGALEEGRISPEDRSAF
jgi:hypothetical protein